MLSEAVIEAQPVSPGGAELGEGPIWDHRVGLLYWVNITVGDIHVYDPATGANTHVSTGNEMVGSYFLTETPHVLVLARESGFYRFDTRSGDITIIANPIDNAPTHRFNDGRADAYGRIWIGTMGKSGGIGALFSVNANEWSTPSDVPAETSVMEVAGPFNCPNGIVWNEDRSYMYHIDTSRHLINKFAFSEAKPDLGPAVQTLDLSHYSGAPDGMEIDREGKLWVAFWGGSCVRRIDPDTGDLLQTVSLPCSCVTSCAFGGPDLTDLYITSAGGGRENSEPLAGALFKVDVGQSGYEEHLLSVV